VFLGVKPVGFCWRFLAAVSNQTPANLTSRNKKESSENLKFPGNETQRII